MVEQFYGLGREIIVSSQRFTSNSAAHEKNIQSQNPEAFCSKLAKPGHLLTSPCFEELGKKKEHKHRSFQYLNAGPSSPCILPVLVISPRIKTTTRVVRTWIGVGAAKPREKRVAMIGFGKPQLLNLTEVKSLFRRRSWMLAQPRENSGGGGWVIYLGTNLFSFSV